MTNEEKLEAAKLELHTKHDALVAEILENIPKSAPLLYHYTSVEAAQKIIESNTIWLTNIRYLNDPNELQCGLDILEKAILSTLRALSKNGSLKDNKEAVLIASITFHVILCLTAKNYKTRKAKSLKERLKKFINIEQLDEYKLGAFNSSIYIASFSAERDKLRQWIPYAKNATGIALGYDSFYDAENGTHQLGDALLVKCCYRSDKDKKKFAEQLLQIFMEWIRTSIAPISMHDASIFDKAVNFFIELLITDLAACKTHEYEDEQEWRLYVVKTLDISSTNQVATSATNQNNLSDKLGFYVKEHILKPYIPCNLTKDSLKEIMLGPCSNELNIDSFTHITKSNGYNEPKITKSKMPYRG